MISNLIIGQRTQAGASTVSNTITVQNWANGQLGISLQDAPVDPLPPEERGLPIRQGDQRPQTLVNGEGLAYYDWASTSYAADGSLTNGVAEANFADVLYSPSSLGSVLNGYGGNDVLGGGAGNNELYSGPRDDRIHSAGGVLH